MRRVVLALAGTFALMMMSMQPVLQPALLALGDIQVTLTCSDGIEITDTTLMVDAITLIALESAVEAMILYPAGLVCRLTEAPLLSASVAGGLFAPSIAFAQSPNNPKKDFVVGGFRVANCRNFSVSAHSDGTTTQGSFTEEQPQPACLVGYPTPGGGKAKVTCLSVVGDVARINGIFMETRGSISGFTHVIAAFMDNGNPAGGLPPPDTQNIAELTSPPPPMEGCNSLNLLFPISNGNISVNGAGATPD
jgi:hypothetical protein